jgi:predicted RNase H-like HicB family nuclease
VGVLEREIKLLKTNLEALKDQQSVVVPVESLDPQPFEVLRPFQVVIRPCRDEYIATFFDANISAGGETTEEAYANLKDLIGSVFTLLQAENNLGPGPSAQLAVLRSFLQQKPV